jgi:hypothetical protein
MGVPYVPLGRVVDSRNRLRLGPAGDYPRVVLQGCRTTRWRRANDDSEAGHPSRTGRFANCRDRESGTDHYPLCFSHLQPDSGEYRERVHVCDGSAFWSNPRMALDWGWQEKESARYVVPRMWIRI